MNFVSAIFILFLITLWLLFVALPQRFRLPLLLIFSYFFYATWSLPFLAVILVTTSLDYGLSQIIHQSPSPKKRKVALVSGLTINLLILFFFKYFNFFMESSNALYHSMGWHPPFAHALSIILPLGISFYTFEAISYMVDVYRGGKPAQNWWEYNFYIMYFPHLISGPIVRFSELVHQYREELQLPSLGRIAQGLELIVLGYIFKTMIADQAAGLVNTVFDAPSHASVLATYLAALGFTVQIYFDFMGYTHIARGASLLFNIELPLNFNFPYMAENISDFWKRWHISLSRWIRDYLFIPLGGSRGTLFKTITVMLVTMTLCGAWHGAGWTYILWGTYHGALLAFYNVFKMGKKAWLSPAILSSLDTSLLYRVVSVVLTFASVVVGWVLFRAPNMAIANEVLQKLMRFQELFASLNVEHLEAVCQLALLLMICFITPGLARQIRSIYQVQTLSVKTALASVALVLCWILTAQQQVPFIYFQF